MLTSAELSGVLAMMPAFATRDGAELDCTGTVSVDALSAAVDKIIRDGIGLLATTGSFGEGYALLPDEFLQTVRSTVEAAAGRAPVIAGCVGSNARDIYAKARGAVGVGADGILLGLPNYFPLTVDNSVTFVRSVARAVPDAAVLLYHNPVLHRTSLPVAAIESLCEEPNVVGMKDSHRDPRAFLEVSKRTRSKLSVFVSVGQFSSYAKMGAAGFWCYDCWMDPAPAIALVDAVAAGDEVRAEVLTRLMSSPYEGPEPRDLRWRETAAKLAIAKAGYCDPGPLRAPYAVIPTEVEQAAKERAAHWTGIRSILSDSGCAVVDDV
jgi:dihydrodipicolinate synthase/N-acetylneuraminate lyase